MLLLHRLFLLLLLASSPQNCQKQQQKSSQKKKHEGHDQDGPVAMQVQSPVGTFPAICCRAFDAWLLVFSVGHFSCFIRGILLFWHRAMILLFHAFVVKTAEGSRRMMMM